jgi:hypothetical protein
VIVDDPASGIVRLAISKDDARIGKSIDLKDTGTAGKKWLSKPYL